MNMAKDDKLPTTRPTTQLDLEARLSEDYEPESRITKTIVVNPNPFGEEEYVGTDPIYQNHANDTEKPYAAKSGADKLAEDYVKDVHDLSDVPDDEIAPDYGFGGKARVAMQSVPTASDVTIGGDDVRHANDDTKVTEKPGNTEPAAGDPTPAESPKQTPAPPVPSSDKSGAKPDTDKNKS